jgi:hypothetical protein
MSATVPTAYDLYFAGGKRPPQDEDLFFHSIECRNGTRKTTCHRRLDDLNSLVQSLLPPQRPLEIMDVAVSSGVSTAEWLTSLEQAGIECRMLAGDAVVDAFLISFGRLRALGISCSSISAAELCGCRHPVEGTGFATCLSLPPCRRPPDCSIWAHPLRKHSAVSA